MLAGIDIRERVLVRIAAMDQKWNLLWFAVVAIDTRQKRAALSHWALEELAECEKTGSVSGCWRRATRRVRVTESGLCIGEKMGR